MLDFKPIDQDSLKQYQSQLLCLAKTECSPTIALNMNMSKRTMSDFETGDYVSSALK